MTSDKPQRSKATKRGKEIWEAMHPRTSQKFESVWDALVVVEGPMTEAEKREEIQVGEVFPPVIGCFKPPPQSKSFAAEAAATKGESKRSVNQHISRADALGIGLAHSAQRGSKKVRPPSITTLLAESAESFAPNRIDPSYANANS